MTKFIISGPMFLGKRKIANSQGSCRIIQTDTHFHQSRRNLSSPQTSSILNLFLKHLPLTFTRTAKNLWWDIRKFLNKYLLHLQKRQRSKHSTHLCRAEDILKGLKLRRKHNENGMYKNVKLKILILIIENIVIYNY